MKITLVGSARFESEFKRLNKGLTLNGHIVYSLAVYPSDEGEKNWYTDKEKKELDNVHLMKILNSDAIYVVSPDGYIGESTTREIVYAHSKGKLIITQSNISITIDIEKNNYYLES